MKDLQSMGIRELRQLLHAKQYLLNSGTLHPFEKPKYKQLIINVEREIKLKKEHLPAKREVNYHPDLLNQVWEYHQQGLSTEEVAIALNVTRKTACNYVSMAKKHAIQS